MITVEEVALALPANLKSSATQSLADMINTVVSEPIMADQIRDNFITYTSVLKDGRYKMEDYLNAVTYVSFKHMGMSNQDAYCHTFPARHAALVAKGASAKDLSAYVSMYHKGKLVNAIMEQSLIPVHILHQDAFNKAIKTQMELMATATSEKVRSDAANSILTHLKPPELKKIEVDIGVKQDAGMTELRDTMRQLAEQQQAIISNGSMTPKQIAESKIVTIEGASGRVE